MFNRRLALAVSTAASSDRTKPFWPPVLLRSLIASRTHPFTLPITKSAAWNFTNAARVELKRQGTQVVGVHVGYVDTDLTATLDVDKVAPAAVAAAALDAVEAGEPEAVVDDVSRQVKAGLSDDQRILYPQIEREFEAVLGHL